MTYTVDEIPPDMAKEALDVQDACNACGVAQALARHMRALMAHPKSNGTNWVNEHPVVVLFLDKLVNLATKTNVDYTYVGQAWDLCEKSVAKNSTNG